MESKDGKVVAHRSLYTKPVSGGVGWGGIFIADARSFNKVEKILMTPGNTATTSGIPPKVLTKKSGDRLKR